MFKSFSLFISFFFLLFLLIFSKPEFIKSKRFIPISKVLTKVCQGDLWSAYNLTSDSLEAELIHVRSGLELIINADIDTAGILHEVAKDISKKTLPPLAKLYLDGKKCNGLSDLFYISAVTIKKIIEKQYEDNALIDAHLTMLTLLSDSGFYKEAELHLEKAMILDPKGASLRMRSILMTPGVYESFDHLHETRRLLFKRLLNVTNDKKFTLPTIDEFVLAPTFYFAYQGYNDAKFMNTLQNIYSRAYPYFSTYKIDQRPLGLLGIPVERNFELDETTNQHVSKIRIGFVSSYFRRHSICKLYCNVITGLSKHIITTSTGEKIGFEVYIFSGQEQSREDSFTSNLKQNVHEFVRVKKFTVSSRREVTTRFIDMLIYLDIGMDPATSVWGASKLATIQACLWGHPSTTGMNAIDYYISSDLYHLDHSIIQLSNRINEFDDIYDEDKPIKKDVKTKEKNDEENDNDDNDDDEDNEENKLTNEMIDEILEKENYEDASWYVETEKVFSEQLIRFSSSALGFSFNQPHLEIEILSNTTSTNNDNNNNKVEPDYVNRSNLFYESIRPLSTTINETDIDKVYSLNDLIDIKLNNSFTTFVLIPQHLPKFHPIMDSLLKEILETIPDSYIIITFDIKKTIWRRTLERRWLQSGFNSNFIENRILWLNQLTSQQYLGVLAIGDIMLDPYPFGGGVTILESLAVCTPVVTLASKQTVPSLTSGIIRVMLNDEDNINEKSITTNHNELLNHFIFQNKNQVVKHIHFLSTSKEYQLKLRQIVCENRYKLYEESKSSKSTILEWGNFIYSLTRNNFF